MGARGRGDPAYAIPCAFVSAHTRGTLECLQPFVHDMRELKRPSGVSLTKVLQKISRDLLSQIQSALHLMLLVLILCLKFVFFDAGVSSGTASFK